ncbi:MAG: TIGR03619 family F420-dependent LLM class oxidoreductase [Acidimicrobiales bacterium]
MNVGVFLPSFLLEGQGPDGAVALRSFARRTEELGFDSLWITDHVITASRFYRVSWLDSLSTLAHVAALTERVRLGTSILILPLRQPAVLAKEVATLHYLSGGRYIFGVGAGWYAPEFEACGVHKSERGRRTDEVLEATMALMRGRGVNYAGRHYRLDDVTVEPLNPVPPPAWVGGGRQLPHAASPEQPELHRNVLTRLAKSDGWIARPTCPPDLIANDRQQILAERERLGLSDQPYVVAHENFTWLEESGSRDEVVAVQQQRFGGVMSEERPWDYLEAVYLSGTIDDIQGRIQARIDAGVEYLMLHTLTSDIRQLELMAKHILEPFHDR